MGKVRNIKVVSDICTGTGTAFFEVPTQALLAKVAILRGQEMTRSSAGTKKSKITFIIETFPNNEDYDI